VLSHQKTVSYSYLVRQKETWRHQSSSEFPLLRELHIHILFLAQVTPKYQLANFLLTDPSHPLTTSAWLLVAFL